MLPDQTEETQMAQEDFKDEESIDIFSGMAPFPVHTTLLNTRPQHEKQASKVHPGTSTLSRLFLG